MSMAESNEDHYEDATSDQRPYLIRGQKVTFCRFCCSSFQAKDEDNHCSKHDNYYDCKFCIKCNVCGVGISETAENTCNFIMHCSGKEHQAVIKRITTGEYCEQCNCYFPQINDHAKTGHTLVPMKTKSMDYKPNIKEDNDKVVRENIGLIRSQQTQANTAAAAKASGASSRQRVRVAALLFDNGANLRQYDDKQYYSSGKHCLRCIRRLTGTVDPVGLFVGLGRIGKSSANYLCRTQMMAEKFSAPMPPCDDPVVLMVEKTTVERLMQGLNAARDAVTTAEVGQDYDPDE